jgi:hypothetical protein
LLDLRCSGANHIYGISVCGPKFSGDTKQRSLVITRENEPEVTPDDVEVAQFLYLLLYNEKIHGVINTITSRVVLILGRFTPERKPALDALRDELRKSERDYVPVVFDFPRLRGETTIETFTLLACMARFVIADISDAKSVLQELQAIVPISPKLPVQPLIIAAQNEPGTFDFFEGYPWFLNVDRYQTLDGLLTDLDKRVIRPAEQKFLALRGPQPG